MADTLVAVGSGKEHRPLALAYAGGKELPVWAVDPGPLYVPLGSPFVTDYLADWLAWLLLDQDQPCGRCGAPAPMLRITVSKDCWWSCAWPVARMALVGPPRVCLPNARLLAEAAAADELGNRMYAEAASVARKSLALRKRLGVPWG